MFLFLHFEGELLVCVLDRVVCCALRVAASKCCVLGRERRKPRRGVGVKYLFVTRLRVGQNDGSRNQEEMKGGKPCKQDVDEHWQF